MQLEPHPINRSRNAVGSPDVMKPMRRIVLAASLLLAAVAAAGGTWLLWSGSDDASAMASQGASASPSPAAGQVLDDLAWWRLDHEAGGTSLTIGTLGAGETATAALAGDGPLLANGAIVADPRVVGAWEGRVVVLEHIRGESVLSAVTAASGEARELVRSANLIFDAELAGDEVVFVTIDPADGAPLGVWTVGIGGGDPRPVDGLVAARPELRRVAVVPWITNLVVSHDGLQVALLRCGGQDCELRVVDRESGDSARHAVPFGQQPVAMFGSVAVMENACVAEDCDVRLFDLATGEFGDLPRAADGPAWTASPIGGDQPWLVVTSIGNGPIHPDEPATVEIVDLGAMLARRLPVQLGTVDIVVGQWWNVGVELPGASFLGVGGHVRGDPTGLGFFLVDAATGEVTPLPMLGQPPAQG